MKFSEFYKNSHISNQENAFKNVTQKAVPFWEGFKVLKPCMLW